MSMSQPAKVSRLLMEVLDHHNAGESPRDPQDRIRVRVVPRSNMEEATGQYWTPEEYAEKDPRWPSRRYDRLLELLAMAERALFEARKVVEVFKRPICSYEIFEVAPESLSPTSHGERGLERRSDVLSLEVRKNPCFDVIATREFLQKLFELGVGIHEAHLAVEDHIPEDSGLKTLHEVSMGSRKRIAVWASSVARTKVPQRKGLIAVRAKDSVYLEGLFDDVIQGLLDGDVHSPNLWTGEITMVPWMDEALVKELGLALKKSLPIEISFISTIPFFRIDDELKALWKVNKQVMQVTHVPQAPSYLRGPAFPVLTVLKHYAKWFGIAFATYPMELETRKNAELSKGVHLEGDPYEKMGLVFVFDSDEDMQKVSWGWLKGEGPGEGPAHVQALPMFPVDVDRGKLPTALYLEENRETFHGFLRDRIVKAPCKVFTKEEFLPVRAEEWVREAWLRLNVESIQLTVRNDRDLPEELMTPPGVQIEVDSSRWSAGSDFWKVTGTRKAISDWLWKLRSSFWGFGTAKGFFVESIGLGGMLSDEPGVYVDAEGSPSKQAATIAWKRGEDRVASCDESDKLPELPPGWSWFRPQPNKGPEYAGNELLHRVYVNAECSPKQAAAIAWERSRQREAHQSDKLPNLPPGWRWVGKMLAESDHYRAVPVLNENFAEVAEEAWKIYRNREVKLRGFSDFFGVDPEKADSMRQSGKPFFYQVMIGGELNKVRFATREEAEESAREVHLYRGCPIPEVLDERVPKALSSNEHPMYFSEEMREYWDTFSDHEVVHLRVWTKEPVPNGILTLKSLANQTFEGVTIEGVRDPDGSKKPLTGFQNGRSYAYLRISGTKGHVSKWLVEKEKALVLCELRIPIPPSGIEFETGVWLDWARTPWKTLTWFGILVTPAAYRVLEFENVSFVQGGGGFDGREAVVLYGTKHDLLTWMLNNWDLLLDAKVHRISPVPPIPTSPLLPDPVSPGVQEVDEALQAEKKTKLVVRSTRWELNPFRPFMTEHDFLSRYFRRAKDEDEVRIDILSQWNTAVEKPFESSDGVEVSKILHQHPLGFLQMVRGKKKDVVAWLKKVPVMHSEKKVTNSKVVDVQVEDSSEEFLQDLAKDLRVRARKVRENAKNSIRFAQGLEHAARKIEKKVGD